MSGTRRYFSKPHSCLLVLLELVVIAGAHIGGPARAGAESALQRQPPALFSLSVGYNKASGGSLEPLRYADDDALQNYLLLSELGATSILLTEADRSSRELFPSSYASANPPTFQALFDSMDELNRRIDSVKRRGRTTVLFFFYSGHGDVEAGEGYVHLQDRRLTRSDLLKLIRQSHADIIHIIIDACKSYFLVFQRGPGGSRRRATGHFLPGEQQLPPNVGLFLSSSTTKDSHEWEAYQGGIFSHEVRSALRGAADLNGDGLITYEEAAAFVYNANRSVPNARFRPAFFSMPQRYQAPSKAVLLDLRFIQARRIIFGPQMSRHFYIEDENGVRLADLHPSQGQSTIIVPSGATLFVRDATSSTKEIVVPSHLKMALLRSLPSRPITALPRGAEHEAFRRLFLQAFDDSTILSYRAQPAEWEATADRPMRLSLRDWLRPTIGAVALAALATGGLFTGLAARERNNVTASTSQLERESVNHTIDRNNTIAVTCYIVGAAAATGFLVWSFWPSKKMKIKVSSSLSLSGQVLIQADWQ